jgi:hypothetical protein
MPSLQKIKWLFLAVALLVCANLTSAQESDSLDEDSPEITARVARVSFIRGDVQVKRGGETEWEDVSLNLPLVEGDEIATSPDSRVEIQFDSSNFLRLAENSLLKITTLRDEGIAVSLSEGLLSLRVFSFEKDKGYFELDAPQTTVSVQQAGLFKVDARERDQVRVSLTEGGEARVYSDTSAFTIRSGRSATVFLNAERLGEWETADAARYFDEWDSWVAERDQKLANLLKNSYYDKYYDRDLYGAEDLNDNGSWSDSDDYGKVWRPNYTSISVYHDWSPYRYGHWRWINPYGWVWINDEPWGWATSHYGRWIYDSRGWGWTPYSYYRPKRSWWRPALVAIFNINNDVCWYPLAHRDRYRDYNRNYRRSERNFGNRRANYGTFGSTAYQRLPENSVIGVRSDDFGRRRPAYRSISARAVQQTLANNPVAVAELPKFEERRREFRRDAGWRRTRPAEQIRTGVTERRSGVEVDKQLLNERFRNNRRDERMRESGNSGTGTQNSTVNNDLRRNERFERRDREARPQPSDQPERRIIMPPSGQPSSTVTNQTSDEKERRSRERQPRRSEEQSPLNSPPNNNSTENTERRRSNERSPDESRVIVKVPENNSMENNRREQRRNENSEDNNRPERMRDRGQEDNERNNVRRENPPENRPGSSPRNNEEIQRPARPRTEESQPREQPPREERREEMRRQEPRREQPRQEAPRVESPREETRREEPRREERREQPRQEQPRQEPPRVERREEPRRESPRQEPPRQDPPRQREQPREERRPVPKVERKPEKPIDN